jgi:hypothetical protein
LKISKPGEAQNPAPPYGAPAPKGTVGFLCANSKVPILGKRGIAPVPVMFFFQD